MEVSSLGEASRLWRRWALLAVAHAAAGSDAVEISDDGHGVLRHAAGSTWIRRVTGRRLVVWGDLPGDSPVVSSEDLLDVVPDWAVDDDTAAALARDGVGYLAWWRRGDWTALPDPLPDLVAAGLHDVRDDDALQEAWRRLHPAADPEAVATAIAEPSRDTLRPVLGRGLARGLAALDRAGKVSLSPPAAGHLRAAVHAQMRSAPELGDRGLARRPILLRQWRQVNDQPTRFRYAVQVRDDVLVPSASNAGLTEAEQRSLGNVLAELGREERSVTQGGWLFAQVRPQGRSVVLERRFDGWPSWFVPRSEDEAPRLPVLAREMARREPGWRPGWAALLPAVERR